MGQRKMNPARLAVIEARAAARIAAQAPRTAGPVSRDLTARTQTGTEPYGWTGTRRHGNKRGRDTKGQGEWRTVSPSYRTAATVDARWHDTNSTRTY